MHCPRPLTEVADIIYTVWQRGFSLAAQLWIRSKPIMSTHGLLLCEHPDEACQRWHSQTHPVLCCL